MDIIRKKIRDNFKIQENSLLDMLLCSAEMYTWNNLQLLNVEETQNDLRDHLLENLDKFHEYHKQLRCLDENIEEYIKKSKSQNLKSLLHAPGTFYKLSQIAEYCKSNKEPSSLEVENDEFDRENIINE